MWTFTDGRAEFSFYAHSADGSVGKSYVLALTGPPFESFRTPPQNPWPLEQDGGGSFFNATAWTLVAQGKGKRDPGCEGGGIFAEDGVAPIRVGVAGGFPGDPPSVKVVSRFLNSPFSLTQPPVPTFSIFDHSPAYDGQVLNILGAEVGHLFGYDGSTYYNFALDIGTEIVAAADGTVIWANPDPPFYCSSLGRVVIDQLFVAIEHQVSAVEGGSQGFATVYKRLQSVADGIEFGVEVKKGDLIGLSGQSGCTSYPNFPFNVRVGGGGVDRHTSYYTHRTDPYGASPTDPLGGVMHQVLWRAGEAPPVVAVP